MIARYLSRMTKTRLAGSPGYTFPLMLIIVPVMGYGASRLELAESYRLNQSI